jgi:hypothetical protein
MNIAWWHRFSAPTTRMACSAPQRRVAGDRPDPRPPVPFRAFHGVRTLRDLAGDPGRRRQRAQYFKPSSLPPWCPADFPFAGGQPGTSDEGTPPSSSIDAPGSWHRFPSIVRAYYLTSAAYQ